MKIKGLKSISLYLYSRNKKIRIELLVPYGDSYVAVSGTDPTWVRRIIKRFDELFEEHRLRLNAFFHSRKIWIFWLIFGTSLVAAFYYLFPSSTSPIIIFSWPFNFAFCIWQWLDLKQKDLNESGWLL
jgi:lipopolysaccharide export LptBFGC system permease protein LptF